MSLLRLHCEEVPAPERRLRLLRSLHLAIHARDMKAIRALCSTQDAWRGDVCHQSLPIAIRTGQWEIVQTVRMGSLQGSASTSRQSVLCMAAEEGHVEIMRQLIDGGEDVDDLAVGVTPLMGAVQFDQLAAVEMLLSHGAILRRPGSPMDPFFHACSMGKRSSALFLVPRVVADGIDDTEFHCALAAIDPRHAGLREELLALRASGQFDHIQRHTRQASLLQPPALRL